MRTFVFTAAALLCLAAPAHGWPAQDVPREYRYVVKGRVVDKSGNPVPQAELQLEPFGSSGGCIIEVERAGDDGRFRIEKTSSEPIEKWRLSVTTPTSADVDVPISPDVGRSSDGWRDVILKPAENDLGDVSVQLQYGLARFRLPEASRDSLDYESGPPRLWLRVSDKRGDVIGDGGVPARAINGKDLVLSVALPEGEWQIRFSVGKLDGWYRPDRPVVIRYGGPATEYSLLPAEDTADSGEIEAKPANSPEAAREELQRLGIPFSEEAFLERVEKDNLRVVRLFLQAGINPNSKHGEGMTGLLEATFFGFPAIVEALLDKGADVNAGNSSGLTPLAQAVCGYEPAIVNFLLSRGANVNLKDGDGRTPLMLAMKCEKGVYLNLLLNAGADIKARDNNGDTALTYAVGAGDSDALLELLSRGGDIQTRNKWGRTLLMQAAERGSESGVAVLLAKGVAVDAKDNNGSTALALAVAAREPDVARALRKAGAKEGPETALLSAVMLGETERVVALLERGANPDASYANGETLLMEAAKSSFTAIAKALLAKGANVNVKTSTYGRTALIEAARQGSSEIVAAILRAGARVNEKDDDGKTALMYAAEDGQVGVLKLLLDRGTDATLTDNRGWTALRFAEWNRKDAIIEILQAREGKR